MSRVKVALLKQRSSAQHGAGQYGRGGSRQEAARTLRAGRG
jgi:hypothetical protein